MIFKNINEAKIIESDNWISRRLLLKKENMGFSLTDTIIKAGTETYIHYKNHLEACYCISGNGEIKTIKDNKVYKIEPYSMYALDKHDSHYLKAINEMRLICVFNPPLSGNEIHLKDGSYEICGEEQ